MQPRASRPSGARSARAHAFCVLGPATMLGGRRLGVPPALPGHAAAPARPGLLVAVRRAAAARRRSPGSLFALPRRAGLIEDLEAEASADAAARRTRPLDVRDRLPARSASACSREAIVGTRSGGGARGAPTSGRRSLFLMGVLMWPVMVFFTNSTIHMLAHGSWAQVMMLAGAAELGLVRGKLHSPLLAADDAARVLRLGLGVPVHEQNRWFFARSAFLHHLLGWTLVVGAIFPLARRFRPRSAVGATGLRADVRRRSPSMLYSDRDTAPIFGHLSPLAGSAAPMRRLLSWRCLAGARRPRPRRSAHATLVADAAGVRAAARAAPGAGRAPLRPVRSRRCRTRSSSTTRKGRVVSGQTAAVPIRAS